MKRLFRLLTLIGSLLAATPSAFAQQPGWHGMWWGWGDGWGYGHMLFGGLAMVVFWGIVVVLAVLAIRWIGGSGDGTRLESPPLQSPLDILKERYARGEIDEAELEERKKVLNRH